MIRGGDFSMLKVWAGLEARSFLQASIESVSVDRGFGVDVLSN
jgi:aarF domain-containing kinase